WQKTSFDVPKRAAVTGSFKTDYVDRHRAHSMRSDITTMRMIARGARPALRGKIRGDGQEINKSCSGAVHFPTGRGRNRPICNNASPFAGLAAKALPGACRPLAAAMPVGPQY